MKIVGYWVAARVRAGVTEIVIPDGTVEIEDQAFCLDTKGIFSPEISSIVIPDTVKKIGKEAFRS